MTIATKKAVLVVGGILAGLWFLERRARAAAKPGGYDGSGINPGSGIGICVEGETGPTACGGDFDPNAPTSSTVPYAPGPLILVKPGTTGGYDGSGINPKPNTPATTKPAPGGQGPPIYIPRTTWEAL